jgi:hypothetical protein
MEVADIGSLAPLEPGTYFMDPDLDPSTSLRVVFEVAADGWLQWIGTFKRAGAGHVGVSSAGGTTASSRQCRSRRTIRLVIPNVTATTIAVSAIAATTRPPTTCTQDGSDSDRSVPTCRTGSRLPSPK